MSQTAGKFTESVQQTQQRQRQRIYSRRVSINEILHFWLQSHSTKEKKTLNTPIHSVIKHGIVDCFLYLMKIQFLTSSVTW
jgi:hypothetical protein